MTLAGRAPALLRHGRRFPATASSSLPLRTFSSRTLNCPLRTHSQACGVRLTQKRLFSAGAAALGAAAQPAPNPNAYLDSGVITPKEHVDVKKVLVIGSGGLAIGQAGEFDYSGVFLPLRFPGPSEPFLAFDQ